MSQKRISFIFVLLFSICFISAVTIYSGETVELELEKQFEYYSVVGNSTPIELEITQHANNSVTITPSKYSQNDSYEVIFFDIEKEVITIYSGGGGGSGGTKTIYKDRNITKYVDKNVEVIKEVPGETVETEKIMPTPWWNYVIIIILLGIVLYLVFFKKQDTDERRFENKNE